MLEPLKWIFAGIEIDIDYHIDGNGMIWFYGPGLAKAFGYDIAPHMYDMLINTDMCKAKDIGIVDTLPPNFQPNAIYINEPGLYKIAIASRRPETEPFQQWLFYDVLPCIRRYGAYIDPEMRDALNRDPNLVYQLNSRIASHEEAIAPKQQLYRLVDKTREPFKSFEKMKEDYRLLQDQVMIDESYTLFGHNMANSDTEFSVEDFAKFMVASGFDTGRNKMYEWLRSHGYMMKIGNVNNPTTWAMKKGYMVLRPHFDDSGNLFMKPVITGAGLIEIRAQLEQEYREQHKDEAVSD